MTTIDYLLETNDVSIEQLAVDAGIPADRVEAIAVGRWLPSPADREKLARALGVAVEEISWGHTMDPRNVRYRRFGMKENF